MDDKELERAAAPIEVPDIQVTDLEQYMIDPFESKHRKARYLRMGNKHWTRKAINSKKANRKIAKKSRRQNR